MTENSNCTWTPQIPSPTQSLKQTGKQQNSKDTPTKTTYEYATKSTNSNQEIDPQLDTPSY